MIDFLCYAGCWVLQTGNINLVLTDSIGSAMEAGQQMGCSSAPYWTSYQIDFSNKVEKDLFYQSVATTMGKNYLSSFVAETGPDHVILSGYCVM